MTLHRDLAVLDPRNKSPRGEAEETNRHSRANLRANRIDQKEYWPLHNRLLIIVKMLDSFVA